jgi:hypothetical protein
MRLMYRIRWKAHARASDRREFYHSLRGRYAIIHFYGQYAEVYRYADV